MRALRKERERFLQPRLQGFSPYISELKQRRRRRHENGQKATGSDKQNNNFARASPFFVHFFAVVARCTTTTWNFLVSSFVEDVKTRQQFSFFSPEL